jgi:hypothetical protein
MWPNVPGCGTLGSVNGIGETGLDVTLISGCLAGDYHWSSIRILDLYLDGVINTGDFLRWFHMPNSGYLSTSECIAATIDPGYDYRTWQPGLMDGVVRITG